MRNVTQSHTLKPLNVYNTTKYIYYAHIVQYVHRKLNTFHFQQ